VAGETGKTIQMRVTLSMRTDGGLGESEVDGCCVSVVNVWSVLSRMRTKPGDFAGCICVAGLISLSGC